MQTTSLSIGFVALFLASGCLPSQIGAGVTVVKAFNEPVDVRPQFRVGVDPLQLIPHTMDRDFDGAFGLVTEVRHASGAAKDSEAKSSLYLQGTYVAARKDLDHDAVTRVNVGADARLSWDADHQFRPGIEPIMTTEVSQFTRENFTNSTGMAHTYGEMGVGLAVSGFFDKKAIGVSAGVLARLPLGIIVPAQM